ncbi:hypothetical protein CesoFtcFv8_012037 [Champsocephalus esox]|uniref:PDZ domain-containing protein n=1 Tax=Champsocephalus esox TaxID=159716 RepID=A0AAN8C269_9TELE|nr:hypothetical protein CesoFtcFv8_012037 [Champsocephalus esox]
MIGDLGYTDEEEGDRDLGYSDEEEGEGTDEDVGAGPGGFGFAIADSPLGQRVKMVLDAQWCRGLMRGDVIKEIARRSVQALSHAQVVDILKELPAGGEVALLVLRGGHTSPVKSLKPVSSVKSLKPCTVSQPPPQRQEVINNSEVLQGPEEALNPNPTSSPVSSSPKPDASELYLRSRALLESKPAHTKDLDVFIKRNQESGFGFRVLGGEGPDQPVYIGAIVPLGAAEKDGRLRAGDELLCIDGVAVKGKTHKQVLELMTNAARNGQVMLTVRRKLTHTDGDEEEEGPLPLPTSSPQTPPPPCRAESFDVFLQRRENEGFGFVILTSKNKPPPGVIPHKIGRVIEGSPTDRSGQMKVGDRISAVNGRSIMDLSHNDIVQLIKEAGTQVTLTVVPEDDNTPLSGTNSAKQSPSAQHRAVGEQPPNYSDRNGDPPRASGTLSSKQGCLVVELERSQRGFGFSLRGGKEYNMGLFILRLAEEGPALSDGRIHVGDQIVEINGEATQGITHTRAIELIQAGGSKVLLLLRAGGGAVPDHSSKDKVAAPLRLSEGPSSSSLSTSEISPSSPKTSEENRSRSHSPRKTEREHSGSLEDMRKDVRKDMRKGQRDHHHHSSSPRKTSKNQEEPQREKIPGIGKSDGDGTLGRRRTKEKEKEEVKKDPRGSSSSSINDPGCNGVNKKTPTISPGPWKVPSSSKIHNQESSYADI